MRKFILLSFVMGLATTVPALAGTYNSKAGNARPLPPSCADDDAGSRNYDGSGCLARVTAYWPGEDYFTTHKMSATGLRLHAGG